MSISNIAKVFSCICSRKSWGSHNILILICCLYCCKQSCVSRYKTIPKNWSSWKCKNCFFIKTSFTYQVISFNFCPSFFKNWCPNWLFVWTWLRKHWIIEICFKNFLRHAIWVLHKKIVINCNCPWLSSNIVIYSINWSIIFCLC